MGIKKNDYQYRVQWYRTGDKEKSSKIITHSSRAYRLCQQLASDTPWRGTNPRKLAQMWVALSRVMGLTLPEVLHYKTRDAALALQRNNRKIEWLRIEMRQVGQWTEMVEPLEVLKPKQWAKWAKRMDDYCDYLDEHPELRWTPRFLMSKKGG